MMAKRCAKTVAFLLVVLVFSCTYTVEKKYVNPIAPPSQLNATIDIEAPQFKDPYLLDWPTNFTLDLQKIGKPLTSSTVSIDNLTSSGTYQNGFFHVTLNPSYLGSGSH